MSDRMDSIKYQNIADWMLFITSNEYSVHKDTCWIKVQRSM